MTPSIPDQYLAATYAVTALVEGCGARGNRDLSRIDPYNMQAASALLPHSPQRDRAILTRPGDALDGFPERHLSHSLANGLLQAAMLQRFSGHLGLSST